MPATIRGQNYLTKLIFRKLCHIQIAKCGTYFGKCWKQKSLPILVFLLHRVPVFVVAKQRLMEFCPDAFLGFETEPETVRKGVHKFYTVQNLLSGLSLHLTQKTHFLPSGSLINDILCRWGFYKQSVL